MRFAVWWQSLPLEDHVYSFENSVSLLVFPGTWTYTIYLYVATTRVTLSFHAVSKTEGVVASFRPKATAATNKPNKQTKNDEIIESREFADIHLSKHPNQAETRKITESQTTRLNKTQQDSTRLNKLKCKLLEYRMHLAWHPCDSMPCKRSSPFGIPWEHWSRTSNTRVKYVKIIPVGFLLSGSSERPCWISLEDDWEQYFPVCHYRATQENVGLYRYWKSQSPALLWL